MKVCSKGYFESKHKGSNDVCFFPAWYFFHSKNLTSSWLPLSNKGRILKKMKLCLLSYSSNNFEPSGPLLYYRIVSLKNMPSNVDTLKLWNSRFSPNDIPQTSFAELFPTYNLIVKYTQMRKDKSITNSLESQFFQGKYQVIILHRCVERYLCFILHCISVHVKERSAKYGL